MEKITLKQFRVIKRGLYNDTIFTQNNWYLKAPIMGKTLADIKFNKCRKPSILRGETVRTKGKEFICWSIDWNNLSQTLYVITVDGKIFYYCFSNIFAPASSAFHTLTEVYWDGHNAQMNWRWAGTNDAECFYSMFHDEQQLRPIEYKKIKDPSKHIEDLYYHY